MRLKGRPTSTITGGNEDLHGRKRRFRQVANWIPTANKHGYNQRYNAVPNIALTPDESGFSCLVTRTAKKEKKKKEARPANQNLIS